MNREQLLSSAIDNETSARVYLQTGLPRFLEKYQTSKKSIQNEISKIRLLTSDNPSQLLRIDSLQEYLDARIAFTDSILSVKKEITTPVAIELLISGKAKTYTDHALGLLNSIQREENRLYEFRKTENRNAIATGRLAFLAFVFAILVLLVVLFARERKKSVHKEQKKSEIMFRGLLESAPDAMVIANEKGLIVLINRQTENLFGYTKEELIGKSVNMLIPAELKDTHSGHMAHFNKEPRAREMGAGLELQAIKKDGSKFPVEISLSPLKTEDGILVSASVRDITSRIKAEQKFRGLLDAAPDATVIVDESGAMQLVNMQAETLFGYSRDEMIGQQVEILIPDGVRHRHAHHRDGFVKDPKVRSMGAAIELFARRKDGTDFPVEISLSPIKTADGLLVSASVRDITERKKNEAEIAHLARLVEDTNTAIFSCDKNYVLKTWNKAAEDLYGYTVEDLIGKSITNILGSQDSEEEKTKSRESLSNVGYWKKEIAQRRKDGSQIFVLCSVTATRNAAGEINGYVFVSRDITERKEADEKIAYLARLIEDISEAVFSFDVSFKAKSWNKAAEKLFDFTSEEVIGKPVNDVIRSRKGNEERMLIMNEIRACGYWTGENIYLKKDGTPVYTLTSITVTRDILGEIEGYVGICRDITESKKAQEQIAYLANLVEETSATIFSCDTDFVAKSWNKAAEELYGYLAEEVIGKSIIPIVRSESSEEKSKAIVKDLEEKGVWMGELTHLSKNNTQLFLLVSITSVRNTENKIDGYVFVCRDITERKILEEQLNKTNAELEAFSYSVSHDLRAPLRGVIGFASILEEEYGMKLDDEGRRITSVIKVEGLKMGNLIDDLLAFSRMGRHEIIRNDVDMAALVREVIATQAALSAMGNTEWVIASMPYARGDISLLRQVWVNLISNAVKYSRNKPNPRIEIGYTVENGQTVFYVKDNGVGFNEKYKNKLFRVFQRLHSVAEFEGTGVGLAIAEKIISKHGGKIWAAAEENKGATFYFSLIDK